MFWVDRSIETPVRNDSASLWSEMSCFRACARTAPPPALKFGAVFLWLQGRGPHAVTHCHCPVLRGLQDLSTCSPEFQLVTSCVRMHVDRMHVGKCCNVMAISPTPCTVAVVRKDEEEKLMPMSIVMGACLPRKQPRDSYVGLIAVQCNLSDDDEEATQGSSRQPPRAQDHGAARPPRQRLPSSTWGAMSAMAGGTRGTPSRPQRDDVQV